MALTLGPWASTICREVFKAIDKQGDGMITEERCAGRAEQLAVGALKMLKAW